MYFCKAFKTVFWYHVKLKTTLARDQTRLQESHFFKLESIFFYHFCSTILRHRWRHIWGSLNVFWTPLHVEREDEAVSGPEDPSPAVWDPQLKAKYRGGHESREHILNHFVCSSFSTKLLIFSFLLTLPGSLRIFSYAHRCRNWEWGELIQDHTASRLRSIVFLI